MWLQDFNCPIYGDSGGCGLQASLEVLRSTEDIEQLRHTSTEQQKTIIEADNQGEESKKRKRKRKRKK